MKKKPGKLSRRDFLKSTGGAAAIAGLAIGGLASGPGDSAAAEIAAGKLRETHKADLVLLGGNIICMDKTDTRTQAVACKDGRVVAVGTDKTVRKLIGKETKVIELEGKTALPAFIDSHCHLFQWAANLSEVDLRGVKIAGEALGRIKERVARTKPGAWVKAYGLGYDLLAMGVVKIDRCMLDEVSPQNPVVVASLGHFGLFNTAALKELRVSRETPDPDKEVWKDANGEPVGAMAERMWYEYKAKVPPISFEEQTDSLEKAIAEASKLGIGTMEDSLSLEETARAYQRLLDEGRLKMRITLNPTIQVDTAHHYMQSGLSSGFGNEWMRLGQTKILLGTLGARTATLLEDYADMPGHRGAPLYPVETIEKFILDSVKSGWSMQIHIMGDGDLEIALNAFEKALKWYKENTGKDNTDLRLTIDHYGVYTRDQLRRTRDLKLWASVQPIMRSTWARPNGFFESRLGHERWTRSVPLGTLYKAGIPVSLGSDLPYSPSMDPRIGIYSCLDGMGQPGEIITAYEAIRGYTIDASRRLYREHEVGSIEVGKLGDFVVLNLDPLKIPKEKIWNDSKNAPADLQVEYTIVGGKVVYRS